MVGISKFVALVLMVAALAWPAAALTACWPHTDEGVAGMKCPPGCPMMAHQPAIGDRVAAGLPGGSCCQISSGKSAPAWVPQVPVSPSQAGVAPVTSTARMLVPVQPQRRDASLEAPALDSSPQAVLCTFLI